MKKFNCLEGYFETTVSSKHPKQKGVGLNLNISWIRFNNEEWYPIRARYLREILEGYKDLTVEEIKEIYDIIPNTDTGVSLQN